MGVHLERNSDGQEAYSNRQIQKRNQRRALLPRQTLLNHAAEYDVNRGDGHCRPCQQRLRILRRHVVEHGHNLQEVGDRIQPGDADQTHRWRRCHRFRRRRRAGHQRRDGKDHKEDRGEQQRGFQFAGVVVAVAPSGVQDERAEKCAHQQALPRLVGDERKHRCIQQRHVAEQRKLVILTGSQQQGRGKCTGHGERRDDLGIFFQRQCGGESGNENHACEGSFGRDQVIDLKRAPKREI